MADAPPTEPKELPQQAQTQKNVGRPKRTPDNQAEYFYDLRSMHLVFFVSSLALFVSLVWMFYDDFKGATGQAERRWKEIQKGWMDIELARLQWDLHGVEQELRQGEQERERIRLQMERKSAEIRKPGLKVTVTVSVLDPATGLRRPDTSEVSLAELEAAREALMGEFELKNQEMNFDKSILQTARYEYEEAEHHYHEGIKGQDPRVAKFETHFRAKKEAYERIVAKAEASKRAYDEADARKSKIEDQIRAALAPVEELKAELGRRTRELDEKRTRYLREKPQIANTVRDAPMSDFFDPRIKVQQQLLPNIFDDYNFVKIDKNDRCHTCHRTIDNPQYAVDVDESKTRGEELESRYTFRDPFLRAFVDWARGRGKPEDSSIEKGIREGWILPPQTVKFGSWTRDQVIEYTKSLMAHPSLELYVGGSSKHPLDKVGCTTCHEGDGRETDFSRAVHMPDTPEQHREWEARYHYHYRHLWDAPMYPKRHIYASCRRCHNQEVELPGGEDYVRAMTLYERAGCYACHRTDSYQVLAKDHAELKKDPRADPGRIYRRPGPPLTHVKDKIGADFAYRWILAPKDFRLTTRMPHFFGQSNARTLTIDGRKFGPEKVEPVIVASIVKYLMEVSESRNLPAPPAPARAADPNEGLKVFEQVGCRACHTATPDEQYAKRKDLRNADDWRRAPEGESWYLKEFGPNLGGIGSKFADHPDRGKAWLWHWVKNPKHYFEDTRMPDLRLSDQEAHDLVAWMMTLRKDAAWEESAGMPALGADEHKIADRLVFEQLRSKMPDRDAQDAVTAMGGRPDAKLLWLGRRMVQTYGCYSCHQMRPEKEKDDPLLTKLPLAERAIDWTNIEGIGVELTGSQPEGNKAVDKFAFGYTEFDGIGWEDAGHNKRGIAFEHGFTGKPYRHVDPENPSPKTVKVHEFRHQWIRNKLFDPRVFDGGKLNTLPPDELLKMPNFYLNADEVRLLTTFVLSFTHHDVPSGLLNNVKKRLDADEAAINRGNRVIRENNCRACHRFQFEKLEVDWTREVGIGEGGATKKLKQSYEWLEGLPKGQLASDMAEGLLKRWGLVSDNPTPRQKAMKLWSYDFVLDGRAMRPAGSAPGQDPLATPESRFVLQDGNDFFFVRVGADGKAQPMPIRRRIPVEGGEIVPHILAYKKAHAEEYVDKDDNVLIDVENEQVLYSRLPPTLRSLGAKAQPQWLFDFLKSPHPIRPALAAVRPGAKGPPDLNVRMPTFGFTDEEAGALVRYFWSRDRVAGVEDQPWNAFPERDPRRREARKEIYKSLVPFHEKNCGECHFISGRAPNGGPDASYKFGPEFEEMGHRLRPRWLRAWFNSPASVSPGTPMPAIPLTEDLEKNRPDGIDATVEYLLDYPKYKTPPAEPPK